MLNDSVGGMSAPKDGAGAMQVEILHGHIILKIVTGTVPVVKIDATMIAVLSAAAKISEAGAGHLDVAKRNAVSRRGYANSCVVVPGRILHCYLDAVES